MVDFTGGVLVGFTVGVLVDFTAGVLVGVLLGFTVGVIVGFTVGILVGVGLFCVGGLVGGTVVLAGGGGFFPGALDILIESGVASSVLANTCEEPITVKINAVTKMPIITHKVFPLTITSFHYC